MPILHNNSTNYVHSWEPNLADLHTAMEYDAQGKPVIRTVLNTTTVQITGPINILSTVTVSSSPENPVHVHVTEMPAITGTVSVSNFPTSVTVTNFTSTVNINTMPNVTVSNFTSTVHVDNIPTAITVTNFTSTVQVSNNVTATITSMPPFTGTATVYQGTNPWVVTGNINVSTTQTDLTVADSNYEMNIARGLIPGQYPFLRSALNPDVNQNVETSIWVEGGIYPHGTWTTAQRIYAASDNAADVGQHVLIEGLNANYDYATAEIVLNGTTAVATAVAETFIRIYTATIISASNNSANAGEIRFRIGSAAGTVVAHIRAGFGITKLSQYTVPRGHTAYVLYGDATTFRGGSGNIGSQIRMMVRPFGMSFVVAFVAEVVNGYYRNDFTVPMKITEKSDIDVRVIADANNTIASCNYQMILIPN